MITWNENTNKTLIGIHDNSKGKTYILKNKYPLEITPEETPFLLTRDSYFEFTPSSFLQYFENKNKEKYLDIIINKIANILIIPGLLIALGYLLKYLNIFDQIVFLEIFLNTPLINSFFWIAFFGVIILWYQHYNEKHIFGKLPVVNTFPESELEDIENNGIQFSKYGHLNPYRYVDSELVSILLHSDKKIDKQKLLKTVLNNIEVEELLNRAEIKKEALQIGKESITKLGFNLLLLYALEEALITKSHHIEPLHFFLAIVKTDKELIKKITKSKSSLNILREISGYIIRFNFKHNPYGKLNPLVEYYRTGGVAKDWIYGYTFILSQFSKDINQEIAKQSDKFGIGHEKEVELLVSVLGRPNKKNALLIGEPGVGKSSLIKGLAQRINRGEVPPILSGARIVQLDLNGLIAYSTKAKNLEGVVQKAINELQKAGNVILYIDQIQELIPARAQQSGHSIADILLPYVLEGKFPIVGTVNYADYKKYFYTNESFRQSFTNIEVPESSTKDSLRILESKIEVLENTLGISIKFSTLIAAVSLAQRYIHDRMLPDSAVGLLEDTCSWAKSNGISEVTSEHVEKIVSMKTDITIGNISESESQQLITLEERIKKRVIGQDDAVHVIAEALRRGRADVRDPNRPVGSFLFIGPTGVGKTFLAKVVSQEYFNNKEDIVRVDMSEYMNEDSVEKFLGKSNTNSGDQVHTSLLDRIKGNPYTVVLFDEIEKAHPKILDLFLQLTDEGRLTSTNGETVDFTNAIIIFTSNIASQLILESIEAKQIWDETKSRVMIELKNSIRPELFNRFDGIVVFHPQNIENLSIITSNLLIELNNRMKEKSIEVVWEEKIPMLIASKAYEPAFGARPIKRYIQEKIEGNIAQEIINGTLKEGDKVNIKESWIV